MIARSVFTWSFSICEAVCHNLSINWLGISLLVQQLVFGVQQVVIDLAPLLIQQLLSEHCCCGIEIPAATKGVRLLKHNKKTITDQKRKDVNVKNYLFQAIDQTIVEIIFNRDTANKFGTL